jgi:Fe-S cluster biogenesis protein NfuA
MTAQGAADAALADARARLRAHGGDVTVAVHDGVAELQWHGACRSCPAVALTLGAVVGPAVLSAPGVHEIRSSRTVAPAVLERLERTVRRYEAAPAAS